MGRTCPPLARPSDSPARLVNLGSIALPAVNVRSVAAAPVRQPGRDTERLEGEDRAGLLNQTLPKKCNPSNANRQGAAAERGDVPPAGRGGARTGDVHAGPARAGGQ